MSQCEAMFCILDEHTDNRHVNFEGTRWELDGSERGYTITHTDFNPRTD
jgi:hypothetical protein